MRGNYTVDDCWYEIKREMISEWCLSSEATRSAIGTGSLRPYAQNRCTQAIIYLSFIHMFLSFGFYERRKTRNKRLEILCLLPRLVQARYHYSITGMSAVSLVLLYWLFEYYLTSIEDLTFNCQFVAMSSSYTKGRTFDTWHGLRHRSIFPLTEWSLFMIPQVTRNRQKESQYYGSKTFSPVHPYIIYIYSLLIRDLLLNIVFILILSEATTKILSQYSFTYLVS